MTNGNIEINHPYILDAIRYHRFGALVEVTNGMFNIAKRQEKKKLVRDGRKLLKKAVGDSAQVVGGLAYIKSRVPGIKELDFSIKIADYSPVVLDGIVAKLLETDMVSAKDKQFLERLVTLAENSRHLSLRSLLNPTRRTYKRLRKDMRHTYNDDVCKVKGALLELYVAHLFSKEINYDSFIVIGTTLRDRKVRPDRTLHTDLIIAAPKSGFRQALEKMVERYAPRKTQRIRVKYQKEF
ncbi:hypothetical protein KY349_06075 [Candidatus Woesearchaeota archaeon]|jgi:hypothetical protein|nr:hypothetical protein [Candidatus Woesearchaeota archaeon]